MAVAERISVADCYRFIKVFYSHDTHHRAENFFGAYFHIGCNIFENGRPEEAGIRIATDYIRFSAIQCQFRALFYT